MFITNKSQQGNTDQNYGSFPVTFLYALVLQYRYHTEYKIYIYCIYN